RPLPTVAKLRIREKSLTMRQGDSKPITLELDRTTNFEGALRVRLEDAAAGITMTDAVIAAGQNSPTATISVTPSASAPVPQQLKLRGTGELSDGVRVVSEATLPLRVD